MSGKTRLNSFFTLTACSRALFSELKKISSRKPSVPLRL
ncbi:hypothetical protein AQPE_2986 [Aquipluma nitroreducens]|uniref:Uncharacterized protein n=1 Tax=Aquipluma nitroreducens TaxID=2010828 RepID=A0A5K7SB66_9BACT|nr:hypothetical protein AQPE_2986 [Aquipluma nitroreducens]